MAFLDQVRGEKTGRANLHEEASRVESGRMVVQYEAHEFTVPTPTLSPGQSLATIVNHLTSCTCARLGAGFDRVLRAQRVTVRNVSRTDSVAGNPVVLRFRDATQDPITLDGGEYLDFDFVECANVFFANTSGAGVPVRVTLA